MSRIRTRETNRTAGCGTRDAFSIVDSYILLYTYPFHEISPSRSRVCVSVYMCIHRVGCRFYPGKRKATAPLPVFWIFDEREHDVPPEFHSGPSRNACRWYFSARQIRVYMVKCSILSGESSYKREFLSFNARPSAPSSIQAKTPNSFEQHSRGFFRQFLSGISLRWSWGENFLFFLLLLLGEYPSFTIISPGRLQFLKRGRHVSRDWNNEMVKIIKNRPTFFREFH